MLSGLEYVILSLSRIMIRAYKKNHVENAAFVSDPIAV